MVFTAHEDFNLTASEETALWLKGATAQERAGISESLLLTRAEQIIDHE